MKQLLFASLFFISAGYSAEAQHHLTVGAVLSLTGPASSHGNAIVDGLEFAKYELEKQGWKITLRIEDDATEPKATLTAIERLVASGVRLFIGPTWGILAIPAAPVIARTKSLSLQPCNSSDFVHGVNDRYFFLFTPPSRSEQLLTEFLKNYSGKKVAIINNISSWGELWDAIFTRAAANSGAELVMKEHIAFNETNQALPTLITRARKLGVEVFLSTTTKEGAAFTFAELAKQKLRSVFVGPDLIDAVSENLMPTTNSFVDGYTVSPKVNADFLERFRAWKGKAPKKYTDSGYDALLALVTAVERVGDDPDDIKRYLETTLDIAGAAGRIRFNADRDVEGNGYEVVKVVSRSDN